MSKTVRKDYLNFRNKGIMSLSLITFLAEDMSSTLKRAVSVKEMDIAIKELFHYNYRALCRKYDLMFEAIVVEDIKSGRELLVL